MENIKESLEYLVELGKKDNDLIIINGENYLKGGYNRVPLQKKLESIQINTLSGLVDYLKSSVDKEYKENHILVTISSPTTVIAELGLNADGRRDALIKSNAITPRIDFSFFYKTEQFNILLQSAFIQNQDRDTLLKVVGNIKEEAIKATSDDGVSQVATIKTGVATLQDVIIPNPVVLRPRRTFNEVEQPESKYIFRMQDGPTCGLFEADGGAWSNEAMTNIKDYLKKELNEYNNITIIS